MQTITTDVKYEGTVSGIALALNSSDPRSTGYSALPETIGKGTDGSYWLKVGELDTDWEQMLVSQSGEFVANLVLEDVSGMIPSAGTLGLKDTAVVLGDGVTTGGNSIQTLLTPTVIYKADGTTDQVMSDIEISWKASQIDWKGLVFGTSCTSISSGAFAGCSGFTGSLIIPNSVTSVGSNAFSGCSGFTGSLIIPNSITTISDGAFNGCAGLTSIIIHDSVTSIGGGSFSGCTGIISITIPDSVTFIEENAFYYCSLLAEVNCYVTRNIMDGYDCLGETIVTELHARATDSTWTAGADTIGGRALTVIKDL